MEYRRLGGTGLKVSALGLGTHTFGDQIDRAGAAACLEAAREVGMNFFDSGENYAQGETERITGSLLAEFGWPRNSYVICTKVFWGISGSVVNMQNTLNRKYLLQAIDGCLERLQIEFVDVLLCHRPDPETPLEETVWAMSDIIASGKALYWGTSQWQADDIRAAWDIAERYHLRKPVMDESEYNLFTRQRVETEYARLYDDIGLGLATYGALAWGSLSGKYLDDVPEGSRAAATRRDYVRATLLDSGRNERVRKLLPIADDLGIEMATLALAWCLSNRNASTVITGASHPDQIRRNVKALGAVPLIADEIRRRIDEAMS
jgi:voltage-dependent potassium channel beta subunit